ncbi:MAG TPA: 4-oxalocrotonate tautomerase family protein [Rhizomicrobium sp.]|jgi:4-oxalocrotonate tautomerase|nr:4-oxalocrotonate tautomerase family protein [Rhizomicrobium sp.]
MPFAIVHIAAGRPLEKRRRLAIAITDAISEIFELDRDQTQVLIQEHDRDSWSIGGELLSERQVAKASDEDLPDLDSLFRKAAAAKAPLKPAPKTPAAKSRPRR